MSVCECIWLLGSAGYCLESVKSDFRDLSACYQVAGPYMVRGICDSAIDPHAHRLMAHQAFLHVLVLGVLYVAAFVAQFYVG